jgi:sugar (pentulose or hexulose) kinase
VVTLKEPEAAAYGAALQAVWNWRESEGEKADIAAIAAKWVAKGRLAAEPNPKSTARYAEIQARFNDLWRRLVPDFEARRKALSA